MSDSTALTFGKAGLPAPANLAAALRNVQNEVGPGGMTILKMDKTGHWCFGTDATEIEEGSTWAIDPFSFLHGFIAWGDGEVLGERMASVSQPLPDLGPAPDGATKGWESQLGFMVRCMDGEDEGQVARYTTTSVGGKRAIQELAVKIADRVDTDPEHPVPVCELLSEHYPHKKFGKIFTPKLKIVDWVGLDLLASGDDAVEDEENIPEAEEVKAPAEEKKSRRASVEAPVADAPQRRRRRA